MKRFFVFIKVWIYDHQVKEYAFTEKQVSEISETKLKRDVMFLK